MLANGIHNISHRFWVSLTLTIILLLIKAYFHETILELYIPWMQFFIVTIIMIPAWPFIQSGFFSIIKWNLNIYTPIALSISIIYFYNIFELLFSDSFSWSPYFQSKDAINFETVAIIITLFLLEQTLELYIFKKAGILSEIKNQPTSIQTRINTILHYFILSIFILAFLSYFVYLFFQLSADGLKSSLTLLIITCPIALSIAASMSIQIGINRSKKMGIIFKDAQSMEKLDKVDVIVISTNYAEFISDAVAQWLHDEDIRIVMVVENDKSSSDTKPSLSNIDAIESITAPEKNIELVGRLQQEGFIVALIGGYDIAKADLNIATNIDTTDIALINDNPLDIIHARKLSTKVANNIRQNLFFVLLYNIICIPLSIGLILNPIWAAVLLTGSSLFVMVNALRLYNVSLDI